MHNSLANSLYTTKITQFFIHCTLKIENWKHLKIDWNSNWITKKNWFHRLNSMQLITHFNRFIYFINFFTVWSQILPIISHNSDKYCINLYKIMKKLMSKFTIPTRQCMKIRVILVAFTIHIYFNCDILSPSYWNAVLLVFEPVLKVRLRWIDDRSNEFSMRRSRMRNRIDLRTLVNVLIALRSTIQLYSWNIR